MDLNEFGEPIYKMDRKTRRRVGALKRILAERDRWSVGCEMRRSIIERQFGLCPRFGKEHDIAVLRSRIPADVLEREGLL